MARCDYFAIEKEFAEVFRSAPTLQGYGVVVEKSIEFESESPMIGIYLERRDASPEQYMAANTIQRYMLTLSIWCFSFGLNLDEAIQVRDDMIGKVELVLLENPTINGLVDNIVLLGGEMLPTMKPENVGVVVGAEIRVAADVTFTTT